MFMCVFECVWMYVYVNVHDCVCKCECLKKKRKRLILRMWQQEIVRDDMSDGLSGSECFDFSMKEILNLECI